MRFNISGTSTYTIIQFLKSHQNPIKIPPKSHQNPIKIPSTSHQKIPNFTTRWSTQVTLLQSASPMCRGPGPSGDRGPRRSGGGDRDLVDDGGILVVALGYSTRKYAEWHWDPNEIPMNSSFEHPSEAWEKSRDSPKTFSRMAVLKGIGIPQHRGWSWRSPRVQLCTAR